MNTILTLLAIFGGAAGTLVAFQVIQLDKFVDPGEAQDWHDKYGKIVKILGPAAVIVGLILLMLLLS